MKETHEYDDIIDLEHHVSTTHKQMSRESRAAQFAPFAALTGHDAAIKETSRLTDDKIIMDENYKSLLDTKLMDIANNIQKNPEITINYFVPDSKKTGGSYKTKTGKLKKIDTYENVIVFTDKTKINFQDIIDIFETDEV